MTRYFVALLPPPPVQEAITHIKQHFADHYASRKAFNAPPHITLQPPFDWPIQLAPTREGSTGKSLPPPLSVLSLSLSEFAATQTPISIQLSGFAAFPPRVIYVNVVRTEGLMALQAAVRDYFATTWGMVDPGSHRRSFTPHITVAFRDLTRANFRAAWAEFQHRSFAAQFSVATLTLLVHHGRCWETCEVFQLQAYELTAKSIFRKVLGQGD